MEFVDWVVENFNGQERGESIEADCPFCDKGGHLYIHKEHGYWTCFKCGEKGATIFRLMAAWEGVSESEIRKRKFKELVKFKGRLPEDFDDKLDGIFKSAPDPEVQIELPEEFVPVWKKGVWQMPLYLKERGVRKDDARLFKLGFCSWGKYAGRIVFPIRCPNGAAFTSRSVKKQEPKYLHPKGAKLAQLVYGWRQAKPMMGSELILVEGTFDVIRLHQHGLPSLGLLGKQLHKRQRALISHYMPSSITIMLDVDAEEAAEQIASELINTASAVYIARLPAGCSDPGESTREQAWQAYREARKFDSDRRTRISMFNKSLH